MKEKRIRALISGRVQGVYYRASTQARARELGLCGWVKNQRDGSVLVEAQGSIEAIDVLVEWCGKGPVHARVMGVQVDNIPVLEGENSFLIVY